MQEPGINRIVQDPIAMLISKQGGIAVDSAYSRLLRVSSFTILIRCCAEYLVLIAE